MVFQRTRIIKGRTYTYWEERYRENGKVKSRHLGKRLAAVIGALLEPVPPEERGLAYIDRLMEKYPSPEAPPAPPAPAPIEKAPAVASELTKSSEAVDVNKDTGKESEKGESYPEKKRAASISEAASICDPIPQRSSKRLRKGDGHPIENLDFGSCDGSYIHRTKGEPPKRQRGQHASEA